MESGHSGDSRQNFKSTHAFGNLLNLHGPLSMQFSLDRPLHLSLLISHTGTAECFRLERSGCE